MALHSSLTNSNSVSWWSEVAVLDIFLFFYIFMLDGEGKGKGELFCMRFIVPNVSDWINYLV